jgi:predicted transport protein
VFFKAPAFIPVLLLGFIVIYHKYAQFKKTINYRSIIVKKDFVRQEVPRMHDELKDFPYVAYRSAGISWGEIYFKMKEQKNSLNMKISLGSINLEGYSDKKKILEEINKRIEKDNG